MKKFILILVLLFSTIVVFSQKEIQARLIYKVRLKQFPENSEITKKQLHYNQIVSEMGEKTYFLDIKNEESMFYEHIIMTSDFDKKLNLISVFVGNNMSYYNLKEKTLLNEKNFLDEDFIIKTIPAMEWQLTQEEKKIGNHFCYKATTTKKVVNRIGETIEKKVIVWYDPKIQLNVGIQEFQGLPGAIILLEDNNLMYELIDIDLNLKQPVQIKKPTKGKMVSENEYTNILLKDYKQKF